jgi:hypothetical protein
MGLAPGSRVVDSEVAVMHVHFNLRAVVIAAGLVLIWLLCNK